MSDQTEVTDVLAAASVITSDAKGHDISNEAYRYYTYPNGDKFRIDNPSALYITDTGSHRVIDTDGVCHRPERGYVGISWKQTDGEPFTF